MRESTAPYGDWPNAAGYPGEEVLADLETADGAEAARIVARYAALRSWLLRLHGAEPALRDHAVSAAREHLEAVRVSDAEWREGPILARLCDAGSVEAPGLLALAAFEAGAAGAKAGAAALRTAAREALLSRLRSRRRRPPRT